MKAFALVTAVVAAAGCGGSSKSSPATGCAAVGAGNGYSPMIVAADFVATVDNPYYPLTPGTVYTMRDNEGTITETTVTRDTRMILGVSTVVVHDLATSSTGEVLEDTWDWFAQDRGGNVWYFGEDTKAYAPDGSISTAGSWEAGLDCAKPGVVMEAAPKVGDSYRQEFLAGVAEDRADVISLTAHVEVPYGTFDGCIMTRDYSDLAPGMDEHKIYCAGVGMVQAIDLVTVGTPPQEDLISVTRM